MMYQIMVIKLGIVNAYILKAKDGRSILIDCGIPGSGKKILKKMESTGIDKNKLQLIIITHGHSDHMGSITTLREATGAKTVIHKLDSDIIRTAKNPKLHPINGKGRLFRHFIGESIKNFASYEPELILEKEFSLHDYGFEGKIIETPGHTNGSISVVMEDGTAFIGDLIMGGMVGKGKPGLPMYADSLESVKSSLGKIISLNPKMTYVGHGGPFTLNEIQGLI